MGMTDLRARAAHEGAPRLRRRGDEPRDAESTERKIVALERANRRLDRKVNALEKRIEEVEKREERRERERLQGEGSS